MDSAKVNVNLLNIKGAYVYLSQVDAETILNNLRITEPTRDLFYRIAGVALELQSDKLVQAVNEIMEQKRQADNAGT